MALYSNQREKGSIFDFGVHRKIRIHLLFQYDKTPCHLKEGTSIKKTADKTTRKVNKTSIVQYLILRLKVITFQSYKFILFLEIQQQKYYWKSKWYCYQSVYHSHCRSKVQSFTVTNTVSISSAVHLVIQDFSSYLLRDENEICLLPNSAFMGTISLTSTQNQ